MRPILSVTPGTLGFENYRPGRQCADGGLGMPRVDLVVPFADKESAKRLGAQWDVAARTWFVPEHVDPEPFVRWLPNADVVNVRGSSYFIAASSRTCWRCKSTSSVHGFILPEGYETLEIGELPDDDRWEPWDEPTLLCYVDYLIPAVIAQIRARSVHYRLAFSVRACSTYWMNHCEHCRAQFDDEETFCEPGGGFLAFFEDDVARISVTHVDETFAAGCGSYSFGVSQFEKMRRL